MPDTSFFLERPCLWDSMIASCWRKVSTACRSSVSGRGDEPHRGATVDLVDHLPGRKDEAEAIGNPLGRHRRQRDANAVPIAAHREVVGHDRELDAMLLSPASWPRTSTRTSARRKAGTLPRSTSSTMRFSRSRRESPAMLRRKARPSGASFGREESRRPRGSGTGASTPVPGNRLDPLRPGSRPPEGPPLPRLPRPQGERVGEAAHVSDQRGVEDPVLRVQVAQQGEAPAESLKGLDEAVPRFLDVQVLPEAIEHPLAGPEGPAGGTDDLLPLEGDLAIVVGDHHQVVAR